MPEFFKKLFQKEEKSLPQKVLDYNGLRYLVKKMTESSCEKLLSETSSEEETTAYLNNSMSRYKNLIFMLIVEGSIKNTITIPVSIVRSGKAIEMICPVDFGEMSARIYYRSDNALRIQTSMASVEIWGTS